MLKLKYLFENYDLARKCLAFYKYDEESLKEMLSQFRISSNAIYPFRFNDEKKEVCFLRLSPTEEKPFLNVLTEIQLIKWLNEKGFPTMKPVSMQNGEYAKEVNTDWGNYNVSCFAKVSGKSLESTNCNLHIIRGYGQILGKLHELMKEYPEAKRHRSHKDLLKEIGERLKMHNASELVSREYLAVCNELEKLSISADNYGVIHYDFEPDNVFYDATEDAFSVIDFDDSICCWYALDIVRALDALDEIIGENYIDKAENCFLEGYQSVAVLTDEQSQSFSLMRRLVRLQEYTTILHVLSEQIEIKPDWMNELIKRLKYKLQCLESAMTS